MEIFGIETRISGDFSVLMPLFGDLAALLGATTLSLVLTAHSAQQPKLTRLSCLLPNPFSAFFPLLLYASSIPSSKAKQLCWAAPPTLFRDMDTTSLSTSREVIQLGLGLQHAHAKPDDFFLGRTELQFTGMVVQQTDRQLAILTMGQPINANIVPAVVPARWQG
jgi:hypothetical protein